MRTLPALAFLAASLPGLTLAQSPEAGWEHRLRGGLEVTYDDNVLFFSKPRIRLFESGLAPDRFKIHSVDDFIFRPWGEAGVSFGDTEVGAGLRLSLYVRNPVKNYEVANLYVRHRFDKDNVLRGGYTWLHDGYVGELLDPRTGTIRSKSYDAHTLDARFMHRFSPLLSLTPRLAGRLLLYNDALHDPRTYGGVELGLLTSVYPLKWLELGLDLSFEDMEAPGGRPDFDVSFRRYAIEGGPTFRPFGRALEISVRYRYAWKVFSTDNDRSLDPAHRDRVDRSGVLRAKIEYFFSRVVSAHFAYERDDYNADIPGAANLSEEDTTFARNAYTVGVALRF